MADVRLVLNVNFDEVEDAKLEVLIGEVVQLLFLLLRVGLVAPEGLESLNQLLVELLHVLVRDVVHVDVAVLDLAFLGVVSKCSFNLFQSIVFQVFILETNRNETQIDN